VAVAAVHATVSGELQPNFTCPGDGIEHLQFLGSIHNKVEADNAARVLTRRIGKYESLANLLPYTYTTARNKVLTILKLRSSSKVNNL
jgi:hypothetical protein